MNMLRTGLYRQLAAHYAEVRARCYGRPVQTPHIVSTMVPVAVVKPPVEPKPKRDHRKKRPPRILPDAPFGLVRHKWQSIAVECAARHGITLEHVFSTGQTNAMAACRREAWARIRTEVVMADGRQPSFTQIGKWFRRDHTTVIHGVQKYEREHGKVEPAGKPNAGYVAR